MQQTISQNRVLCLIQHLVLPQGELGSRSTWAWLDFFLNLEAQGCQGELMAFPNLSCPWWRHCCHRFSHHHLSFLSPCLLQPCPSTMPTPTFPFARNSPILDYYMGSIQISIIPINRFEEHIGARTRQGSASEDASRVCWTAEFGFVEWMN